MKTGTHLRCDALACGAQVATIDPDSEDWLEQELEQPPPQSSRWRHFCPPHAQGLKPRLGPYEW